MKNSNRLEIVGVLSLSLLITSAFAVSSCLPEMLKTFSDYDLASLELLMSAPSFMMLLMIALTPIISRYLSERFMVVTGLLLFGISGLIPVFVISYPVIFASRIFMGIGIGLLNAKAVSMIGERFTGDLRSKLQGIRCSMETLGSSILMFLVGLILPYGWNYTFIVYGAAFIILLIYLAFVPTRKSPSSASTTEGSKKSGYKLTRKDGKVILLNFLLGVTLVSAQMIISLRITSFIVESGIGTSVNGANVLSLSVFSGFIGGLLFGKMVEKMKNLVLPFSMFMTAVGLCMIAVSGNLVVAAIGACIVNLFLTCGLSYMFNGLSDRVPVEALNTANSMVLVGCNLGSSITPFILSAISMINPDLSTCYMVYGVVYAILAVGIFIKTKTNAA